MTSTRFEADKIIKDVGNHFRIKKEIDDTTIKKVEHTTIKDVRNLFRLQKEYKVIKDIIIRDVRNLSEHEEEESY